MKNTKINKHIAVVLTIILTTILAAAILETPKTTAKTDEHTADTTPTIINEITGSRTKFTKLFAMSDGSFTSVSYSMPTHMKKNGKWKEINTTLVKSGKNYKTKATDLGIKVAKKANKKATVTLNRGSYLLSVAPYAGKIKGSTVKISNPKKKNSMDVCNVNHITYKNVMKNTDVLYDIYPEKLQEIIRVTKKQKAKSFSIKINTKKLKVKVKKNKVYFKTAKGTTKYTRFSTRITDAAGASTTKVKVSYDKEKKLLTITPDKKWWNSKKRKYPMEIRTNYLTSEHERDVKVGAAYTGAPEATFGYDKSLLVQSGKCVPYVKMNLAEEVKGSNVQIRDAKLYIKNEKAISMGAGKTFDVGIHKVLEDWSVYKLTFKNRAAYEEQAASKVSLTKKGIYTCDLTGIVKEWCNGVSPYGVALVAENANKTYQAHIDRNPYVSVNYEVIDFEGAVELSESSPVTREVTASGQENYYYFQGERDVAYDIYCESALDTQATQYDANRNRIAYDDNSGLNNNFMFTGTFNDKRFFKVSIKDKATGSYTIFVKKRFTVPEPTGVKGQDKYTINWNPVENAKEYVVTIYDSTGKIGESIVTGTSYDYVYNQATAGKTLGFTVTARENSQVFGEPSRMIFSSNNASDWVYATPMQTAAKNASAVAVDGKIYVLGGEAQTGANNHLSVYDTAKKSWESLAAYPGSDTGICNAAMAVINHEIYVIGGQTDTTQQAKLLQQVYAYNIDTRQWQKKKELSEGRTRLSVAVSEGKIYTFSQIGTTQKAACYHPETDTWEETTATGTSMIISAVSVDNRIFVLKEDGDSMYMQEYSPEEEEYQDAGAVCPYTKAEQYETCAATNGKVYMMKETETNRVLCYDVYTDEWSEISPTNLTKENAMLVSSGNELYSIGGETEGFGVLDVVEQYSISNQTIIKKMNVKKGEVYEIQINAGNLSKDKTQIVSLSVDPKRLEVKQASSFGQKQDLMEGLEGVTLLKYQPKKGLMVLELKNNLEQGTSYEAYQSVPVEAKIDGTVQIKISLSEKEKK